MIKDLQKIPASWKKVKLGEVTESIKEVCPKGSFPYLEIGDIDVKYKRYILKEKTSPEHCVKATRNCVVISKVRPTRGALAKIKENFLFASPALLVLNSDNNNFLFYALSREHFSNYLGTRETGTTYPSVNDKDILDFDLLFPNNFAEQEKIAEILETVDNTIEKTDAIIEKYKRIKQGLMQELLTKGIDENWEVRSEKTHKFKDSPLGRIPSDWEVKKLEEIGKSFAGGTPSSGISEYYNGDIKWLKSGEINSKYIYNTEETLTSSGLRNSNAKWIEGNTVVIAMYGATAGQVGIVKTKMTANQAVLALSINEKERVYFEYLYYSLLVSVNLLLSNLQGSGQPNLNKGNIDNLIIALPPLPEQERIASVLSQVDTVIEKETAYRDKLSRIKQGLMEDLLTGKVRVTTLLENNTYQKEAF